MKKPKFTKMQIRLSLGIPAIIVFSTLSSGILTLSLCKLVHDQKLSNLHIGIAVMAVTMIFFIIGILLARGITNPLQKIMKKAENVLPEGRIPHTSDEMGNLTSIFDEMYLSLNKFITDRQILEGIPEALIVLNKHGTIIRSNQIAEKFFGESLNGHSYLDVIPDCSQNVELAKIINKALKGEKSVQSQILTFKNRKQETYDGVVSVFYTKEDAGYGIVIYIKDLGELNRIREQIKRTENLAEIGTMTSILSHEIRNPLGAIRGLVEIIDQSVSPEDQRKEYLKRIIDEIDRITKLSGDILSFLRINRLQLEPGVSVNELLSRTVSTIKYEFLDKHIVIEETYNDALPPIDADPNKLIEAFTNVLVNSFHATPANGKITIATDCADSFVSVRLQNTGSYIPQEKREDIFSLSYTTKSKGTGMGLFLVKKIVSSHEGTIEVESSQSEGTVFILKFPLSAKEAYA